MSKRRPHSQSVGKGCVCALENDPGPGGYIFPQCGALIGDFLKASIPVSWRHSPSHRFKPNMIQNVTSYPKPQINPEEIRVKLFLLLFACSVYFLTFVFLFYCFSCILYTNFLLETVILNGCI